MEGTGTPAELGRIRDGLQLFNEGFFFEAHEVLEEVWRQERGEPRLFLQGLIQICAGFHHFQNTNLFGAIALLTRGSDKMKEYPPDFLGVDSAGLLREVDAARARMERVLRGEEESGNLPFPRIRRAPRP